MVALQCHDVLHICSDTRLLLTEPPTQDKARRLPKDHLPRRVLVRVRHLICFEKMFTYSFNVSASRVLTINTDKQ